MIKNPNILHMIGLISLGIVVISIFTLIAGLVLGIVYVLPVLVFKINITVLTVSLITMLMATEIE